MSDEDRKLREPTRIEIARHEAGHAVAFLALGFPFVRALVFDQPNPKGGLGAVEPESPEIPHGERITPAGIASDCTSPKHGPFLNRFITMHGIAYLAGAAAQFPNARGATRELRTSSASDRDALVNIAFRYGRIVGDLWPWFSYACDFVDHHWGEISAIAEVLRERGELTAAECSEIAARAQRAVNIRPPWAPNDPIASLDRLWVLPVAPERAFVIRLSAEEIEANAETEELPRTAASVPECVGSFEPRGGAVTRAPFAPVWHGSFIGDR